MARSENDDGGAQLFTASDVARFCQVDLKTIHNWVERGEIRHFRTPGRHLRFRRTDVLDFLRRYRYPVPDALRGGRPRVVVVDREPGSTTALKRTLGRRFELFPFDDAVEALVCIGRLEPDALILDAAVHVVDVLHVVERLREIEGTAHVRTVVYAFDDSRRDEALRAGASAYVVRGRATELRDVLERLTGIDGV